MLKDIMSKNIVVMDINSSINEVAKKMKELDIGFMPISKNNSIIGVITDRDIVVKILANDDNKLEGYLNKNLIIININKSIDEALNLMGEKKVKRLLIENNNKLVGIISLSDILNSNPNIVLNNIKKIFTIYRNNQDYKPKVNDFEL